MSSRRHCRACRRLARVQLRRHRVRRDGQRTSAPNRRCRRRTLAGRERTLGGARLGPVGAELAAELGLHTHRVAPAHILAIVASQTERTRDQLAHAETTLRARWVDVDPANTDADEIFQRLRALAESAVRGSASESHRTTPFKSTKRTRGADLRCLGDVAARAVAELRPAGLDASRRGGRRDCDRCPARGRLRHRKPVAATCRRRPFDGWPARRTALRHQRRPDRRAWDAATICLEHLWAAHIRHSIRHDRVGQSTDPARGRSHQREGDT